MQKPGMPANAMLTGCLYGICLAAGPTSDLSAAENKSPRQPVEIGSQKQLFIDEKFIETKRGITLSLNPPVQKEPIDLPSAAAGFPYVVEYEHQYFMYTHKRIVAISKDGVHWELPEAGKPGSKVPGEGVFIDPKAADGYPFKALWGTSSRWGTNLVPAITPVHEPGSKIKEEGALYLYRSKDGFNWEIIPKVAVPFICDTDNQVLYDPRLDRYVAYLRGFPEQPGSPYQWKRVGVRTEITDLMQMPWPFRKNESRPVGPLGCYSYIYDEMEIVLAADENDPPHTDMYTPAVNFYPYAQDVYLAFPAMFRTYSSSQKNDRDFRGQTPQEGLFETHLAISRDGKQFARFRTPYLKPGMISDRQGINGEPDSGYGFMGIGMVRQGDYLYQYYWASRLTHIDASVALERGIKDVQDIVYRVVQRLDGFISVDAGSEGGEFVTPPLIFSGNRLMLNANCGGLGEIWVELQAMDGTPIPGYSLSEAVSIDRNGTAQEIWWKNGPDTSPLAGKPVRMRIKMRSAKLYAFQFIMSKQTIVKSTPREKSHAK